MEAVLMINSIPAVTPFEPIRKLQTGLIGLLVANCVLGFNFIFPLLTVMMEEFSDDSEFGGAAATFVGFLLIMLYIVAFVMTIIGFAKFSAAKKVNDKIVAQNAGFNNQPYGVPGFGSNAGGFQPVQNQNASYPRANQGTVPAPQNLNGFRVVGQNPVNDVPAGYEAPPDLNGYNNPYQNRYSPQPNKFTRPANSARPVNSAPSAQAVPYAQASVPKPQAAPKTAQGFTTDIPPMAAPVILPAVGIGAAAAQNGTSKTVFPPSARSTAPQNVSSPAAKSDIDILKQTDILQQEKGETNLELPQMPQMPPMPEIKNVNAAFGEKITPFENKTEKRCPHCGVVNPEKNNFCEFCGKEL